jgi:hypothetical protein
MDNSLILYGKDSHCCNADSIIVRSRERGFVTQNCQNCGRPRALHFEELPPLVCGRCQSLLRTHRNFNGNYAYLCPVCGVEVELATIVPHWDELFDRCGYALESDGPHPRPASSIQYTQIEALRESLKRLGFGD